MIAVEAVAPAHIVRTQMPGGSTYTTFRVGEMSGSVTTRATEIARLLSDVDSARVTTNLWGERWAKLVANTMTSGLCGVLGVSLNDMIEWAPSRRVQIRLGAEAIRVGEALGYAMEPIRGVPAQQWLAAACGDAQALQAVEQRMVAFNARRTGEGWSGTAQDLAKGRRTEVDWMNGYVAARGAEIGVPAPTHAAVAELVRRMERREISPSRTFVEML
jgi:2-dehydropantoate 2-reductase